MPLKILPASGSGSATLVSVAGTTTNDTLTLPARTGNIITSADTGTVTQAMLASNVAGNGPSFSAWGSISTSVSNATETKIAFQTKEWDTASCYDNTTNYRFMPNIAGYYLVSAGIYLGGSTGQTYIYARKSGVPAKRLGGIFPTSSSAYGSALVYCNGSTDYIEIYAYQSSGSSQSTFASVDTTYFQAALVRAA